MADKTVLRQLFLQARNDVSQADQELASKNAANLFMAHVALQRDDVIAGYYPIGSELNTLPLLQTLATCSHILALPCIVKKGEPLEFRTWKIKNPLERHTHYPVFQPSNVHPSIIPTVIIVPLLAFDKHGHRLGYGGGFYDRTIDHIRKQHKKIQVIGYGYHTQYTDNLMSLPHDQTLDYVITDKQFFRFS